MNSSKSTKNESVLRIDAPEKVHGAPVYSTDFELPGMLHAKVLRSYISRGKILSIDTKAAYKVPGVISIVTSEDVSGGELGFPELRPIPGKGIPPGSDWPSGFRLFPSIVNFIGEGIAAVAAETAEAAQEAVDLIEVEIEEMPPVLTMDEALSPDAQLIFPHGNLVQPEWTYTKGNVEKALTDAFFTFEGIYKTPRQAHAIIEPLCAVAAPTGQGRITIWTVVNSPHEIQQELAILLGMNEDKIRVICTQGPSYGARDNVTNSLEAAAGLLALKTGRPIRIALTSEETFQVGRTRHESRFHIKTGVDNDGRIIAMWGKVMVNSGAYSLISGRIIESIGSKFLSLYDIPNIHFEGQAVRTNTVPAGSYRCVASVQNYFAVETQLNEIATKLNIDPVKLRQINHIKTGAKLFWGTPVDSSPLERCISQGADKFGWNEKPLAIRKGNKAIGRGMAISTHHTGIGNVSREGSAVRVQLTSDGHVEVITAIPDNGQGSLTALTIMAANALDLPLKSIRIRMGDTLDAPFDYMGAGVNRVTYITGTALRGASAQLKKILEVISKEAQIPYSFKTANNLALLADWHNAIKGGSLPSAEYMFRPKELDPLPTFAAHFAEVEVSLDTGEVKVLNYVAAQDLGEIINPDICTLQVEGGVYHAIGMALFEELHVEEGMVTNGNFMEYSVGGVGEWVPTDVILVGTENLPPKGVGTSVAAPVAPAIVAAIANATGYFLHEVPATPTRVLEALGKL